MSSTDRTTACRARDPRVCPVHGDPASVLAYAREQQALNADRALKTGDIEAYFHARQEIDKIPQAAAPKAEPETFAEAVSDKFGSIADKLGDKLERGMDKFDGLVNAVQDIHSARSSKASAAGVYTLVDSFSSTASPVSSRVLSEDERSDPRAQQVTEAELAKAEVVLKQARLGGGRLNRDVALAQRTTLWAKEFGTVENRAQAVNDEIDTKLETAVTLPSFKDIKAFFGSK